MRKIFYLSNDLCYTDFSPTDVGKEKCDNGHTFGPAIRKHYLIHFIVSGEGRFENENGKYTLGEGDAFLIRPGELTVYSADSERPWEYFWIGFEGKLATKFQNMPDVFKFDFDILSEFTKAFDSGKDKEALFISILFKLYASLNSGGYKADHSTRVINYINLHYMENVTISSIAEMLGLNRKYLARIFKEKNGISMQEYLINKRLHEAKKLLRAGYNVEQSSYIVGYSDPFGFSKAFKRKYGIPPSSVLYETVK